MPTRLILAEDDTLIRMDLKEELQRQGYLVVGDAGDGQSAVNLTRELRPDLVVMDVRMPQMDGITAAQMLKREKLAPVLLLTAFSDQVLITERREQQHGCQLLTAFSDQDLIDRAKDAGVVNYVTKPWRQSDLKPAIEVTLARYRESCALESRAHTLEDQLATRKVVEQAKGILMQQHNLTEQDAYRLIQKLSMNNRKSMREVAEAILLTTTITEP